MGRLNKNLDIDEQILNPKSRNSGGRLYNTMQDQPHTPQSCVCHECGIPGHKRPQCPNRVRRFPSPCKKLQLSFEGFIAGKYVSNMRFNTGADKTVVRADLILGAAYIWKCTKVDSWRGNEVTEHYFSG